MSTAVAQAPGSVRDLKLLDPAVGSGHFLVVAMELLFALYRMGYRGRMTGHGFRGVASTALHEMGFRHDIIELQLAHQERDEVSAAYNHATYLGPRREMMQAWADELDRVRKTVTAQADSSSP